jgi:hypothetical protein
MQFNLGADFVFFLCVCQARVSEVLSRASVDDYGDLISEDCRNAAEGWLLHLSNAHEVCVVRVRCQIHLLWAV